MVKILGKKNKECRWLWQLFLVQGCPPIIHCIVLIHPITIIRLSMAQKLGLLGILFIQLLTNKHIKVTKIPPF